MNFDCFCVKLCSINIICKERLILNKVGVVKKVVMLYLSCGPQMEATRKVINQSLNSKVGLMVTSHME